jgi:hypothetical protein
VFSENHINCEI